MLILKGILKKSSTTEAFVVLLIVHNLDLMRCHTVSVNIQ